LLEDSQEHLWLGTDGGVVHYDGQLFQTIYQISGDRGAAALLELPTSTLYGKMRKFGHQSSLNSVSYILHIGISDITIYG